MIIAIHELKSNLSRVVNPHPKVLHSLTLFRPPKHNHTNKACKGLFSLLGSSIFPFKETLSKVLSFSLSKWFSLDYRSLFLLFQNLSFSKDSPPPTTNFPRKISILQQQQWFRPLVSQSTCFTSNQYLNQTCFNIITQHGSCPHICRFFGPPSFIVVAPNSNVQNLKENALT